MARITRSKKIDLTEDNTALAIEAQTLSLPDTDAHIQPLAVIAGNEIGEEVPVELQLKDLKAQYREAVGPTKKSKKGKNKIKQNAQQAADEAQFAETDSKRNTALDMDNVHSERTKAQPENGREELVEDVNGLPQLPHPITKVKDVEVTEQPVARITRRQAKAQEGSYEEFLSVMQDTAGKGLDTTTTMDIAKHQHEVPDVRRARGTDFIMSLIAGRYARLKIYNSKQSSALRKDHDSDDPRGLNISHQSTSLKCLEHFKQDLQAEGAANIGLLLAEQALGKVTHEDARQEATDNQPVETTVPSQTEPEKSTGNAKDSQTNRDSVEHLVEAISPSKEEDSFLEHIISRSPAKRSDVLRDSLELRVRTSSDTSTPLTYQDQPVCADHPVKVQPPLEMPTSRAVQSPIRIEDSVEALDEMEAVEEALHEATMAERMISPDLRQKERRQKKEPPAKQHAAVTKTAKQPLVRSGSTSVRIKQAPKSTSILKRAASMILKASDSTDANGTDVKPSARDEAKRAAVVKRPTSLIVTKDSRSTKPPTRPMDFELPGEAVSRRLKEQRERRLAQREANDDSCNPARTVSGPMIKSTKPLTKPNFELPGEALSRKKKEAHEIKVKAQEEEERRRREFKAQPVRNSVVPSVRETVTSRVRQGKVNAEGTEEGSQITSKRSSMNLSAHRSSIVELNNIAANTSAPRSPGPVSSAPLERKSSTKFNPISSSGPTLQRTVSFTEVQLQRQRAKELYDRDQKLGEDIEREKRGREAAAKRSREEAAERGRQASREWAEKQRAKKLAEGDKGMSAGYGPGGQIGL